MTAGAIVSLLALRHSKDLFVEECKDGPTQTRSHLRLDAWVLRRTWSPITTIGYEVKVSRSDWMRDRKVMAYMPLCHQLIVVAPKGIVQVEELPYGVGLLEVVGPRDDRLVMRHKPAFRDIDLPTDLLVYVLMCRAKIGTERDDASADANRVARTNALREWAEGKREREQLSWVVSRKIRDAFEAQERRLYEMERRAKRLESVEQRIRELGFDPEKPSDDWRTHERLEALAGVVTPTLVLDLRRESARLASLADDLGRLANHPVEMLKEAR